MPEPRSVIGDLWRQVNRGMHERIRHTFRTIDLPPMSFPILMQIKHSPGITVSELARRSGTVKSHVSKMMEQLVQQGYLEKRPDPDDQRLVRIYPTQAAANSFVEMEERVQAFWSDVVATLPDEEVDKVVDGLRILLTALQRSRAPVNKD